MKRKIWGLVFVVLAVMIILSGCESGSSGDSADVVYNFAGSVGKGDFINVEVNMSDKYLNYAVKPLYDPEDVSEGTYYFEDNGGNFYSMNEDKDHFFMINNEILIATDSSGQGGEQIITALSETKSDYGSEIQKTYNIITSLEGNWGTVDIQSDKVFVELYDGSEKGDTGSENLEMNYSFDDSVGALKLVEDTDQFMHYGVFLDDKIAVFDSYWIDIDAGASEWSGDGMSILVEQNNTQNLFELSGDYKFIDVDGEIGNIIISADSETSMSLTIKVTEGEFNDNNITEIENESGLYTFRSDIGGGDHEDWSMMLVPDKDKKILILGTKDPNVLGAGNPGDEDGGIFIGIEQ